MSKHDLQSSFEEFRRDRTYRRLQNSAPVRPLGKNASVLRELEAAEQQEIRSERLTREVHDFFADATRTAAGIVNKISEQHEVQIEQQFGNEMEDFLRDVITRAEAFMMALQIGGTQGKAQQEMAANMQNLVGQQLDQFRHCGTAQLRDKHIGQDPFHTPVERPAREAARADGQDAHHAEDELPAAVEGELEVTPAVGRRDQPERARGAAIADMMQVEEPASAAPEPAADGGDAASLDTEPLFESLSSDPDRMRAALELMVRNGILPKDEARAIVRKMISSMA